MRTNDLIDQREIERAILDQPVFEGGTLEFVRSFSAHHSQLFEYSFKKNGWVRPIIVKRYALGITSERATLQELSNLEKVRRMLGVQFERSVPEPLLALPKKGILVTSKVPGTSFTVTLKKHGNRLSGLFSTSAIGHKGRRVGMWLRQFQDATRAESLTFNTVSFLTDLEGRLAKLHTAGFEPGLAQEILRRVSFQSTSLNEKLIPAAASHGDFIAQNILVEDDQVAVVDFEGFCERKIVYDDPGMFLGYLLLLRRRLPYSPRSLEAAQLGFLAGFEGSDPIDQALLNIYILKGAVRIMSDGPPLKKGWGQLIRERILTKHLMDLAGDPPGIKR